MPEDSKVQSYVLRERDRFVVLGSHPAGQPSSMIGRQACH